MKTDPLTFARHCEAAIQICESDNLAEAEAFRLVWLMHGGRFPAQQEKQPSLLPVVHGTHPHDQA